MKTQNEIQPVSRRELGFFAAADFFGGGAQALIGVLYFVFLAGILGINPGIAGTVVLVSKLWDAVTDPLMGIVSDNTRSRIGRRRPYIIAGGALVVVAFLLMWMPIAGIESATLKVVFVTMTYVFFSTVSTIVCVPYSSLSAEISTVEKERNAANVLRLVVSTVASAVCTLVPGFVLSLLNSGLINLTGFYLIIGLGFGTLFSILLILAGIFTRERAPLPLEKSKFGIRNFTRPLQIKSFRQLIGMYLCQSISMDVMATGITLYANYAFGTGPTVFLGIFIGVQLLMFPVVNKLIKKTDKTKIYFFGLPLSVIAMAFLALYPSSWSVFGAYAVTGLVAIGFAGAQLISWIIFPHAVDAGELKFKVRITGSFSGIMTFVRKTASAIAIAIFGWILQWTGFNKIEWPLTYKDVSQPLSALAGIRTAMTVPFIVLLVIGFFIAFRSVLTRKNNERVAQFLTIQREEKLGELTEEEKAEYEALVQKMC